MRIVIVGASGFIGSHLVAECKKRHIDVVGTFRQYSIAGGVRLDLADVQQSVQTLRSLAADMIIVPAAATNVEFCEIHASDTWNSNVQTVRRVIEALPDTLPITYFSSEYVFDGENGPYDETRSPHPISNYGRQKVAMEEFLLSRASTLIIRTVHVFGREERGKNFLYTVVRHATPQTPLRVPTDQVSTPTSASQLASAVVSLALEGVQGLGHIVGTERMSRYEFATRIARYFGMPSECIAPVLTRDLSLKAPRPLSAGLTSSRFNLPYLGLTPVDDALSQLKPMREQILADAAHLRASQA